MKKIKIIAGNCILEDIKTSKETVEFLIDMSDIYDFDLIFKSSFKKDNRSSDKYYTGPGLEKSIEIFKELKDSYDINILTDFHHIYELDSPLLDVIDILQIPAYLCMQTELVIATAKQGKPVNIKKGQFLHPEDVSHIIKKIKSTGNKDIMITERGTCFGYRDLVVDPRSLYILKQFNYPIFVDIGHSVRQYGIPSAQSSGGNKKFITTLAKMAIALDCNLFVEVHPNPKKAKCDAATQLSFWEFKSLMKEVM